MMINFQAIHTHVCKYIFGKFNKDDTQKINMTWEAINRAYLKVNPSFSEAQQSQFIINSAIGYLYNEIDHQAKYIVNARMPSMDESNEEHVSIFDTLTDEVSDGDIDLIVQLCQDAPDKLKRPLIIVLNGIFSDYFKRQLTVELIRQRLKRYGYKGHTTELAKQTLNYLISVMD